MNASAKILVVDDTPNNVTLLEDMLTARGHSVATAADGVEALAKMASGAPDLVLLDIMMPRMNGYQVLEHLKADSKFRNIPVIVISAVDDMDSVVRCVELGAEDYLPKPFNPTLLRARVGAILEKKRMRDEIMRHTRRMEQELESARAIQLSMVPTDFPNPSHERPLTVYATLQPAQEVGGDLYDFFWVTPDQLCVVVADVSDKGAPAALYMSRAKAVIRVLATQVKQATGEILSPAELVASANQELCQDNPHAMFVTLFLCLIDARTGKVEWCNAGHNSPYLTTADGGLTLFKRSCNLPAGIEPTFSGVSETSRFASGATLFIFTDGITEAMNSNNELFGSDRLETALRAHASHGPREMVGAVIEEVRRFTGGIPPSDDITAVACRWGM